MHLYSKAERNSMIKYFEIWGERTISHSTRGHGERTQENTILYIREVTFGVGKWKTDGIDREKHSRQMECLTKGREKIDEMTRVHDGIEFSCMTLK